MKIMRYQLSSLRNSVLIFYLIYIAAMTLVSIGSTVVEGMASMGTDLASAVFLFVAGLCSFREPFLFSQSMGVSRKSFFKGSLLAFAPLCFVMTLVDFILNRLQNLFVTTPAFHDVIVFGSGDITGWIPGWEMGGILRGLLWSFLLYVMVLLFGFFLTQAYYRSNKAMKVVVSLGLVAVVNIWNLPYLYPVWEWIVWFVSDDLRCSLFFAVLSALFAGGAWLLTRRASVKS